MAVSIIARRGSNSPIDIHPPLGSVDEWLYCKALTL
jgi:hypothetical protein